MRTNAKARPLRAALLLSLALGGAAGCLIVAPLDPLPEAVGGMTTAGKSPGGQSAGGSSSGNGPTGGTAPSAAGEGASAGQSNPNGECHDTDDCKQPSANKPYFCRPSDHRCVALTSDTCPLYYGKATDPNAIYFGSFATLNPSAPADSSVIWAERLALDELSGSDVGGLLGGPNGSRRPLVMIVCNNDDGVWQQSVSHLVEDVQVPAMIANLQPNDLRQAFEMPGSYHPFFLSPVAVTNTVVNLVDDGLIWNLLGQPSDLAPTYTELLKLAEKRLRMDRKLLDTDQLKVALVSTNAAFDSDLTDAVEPLLRFNGDKTAQGNGDNYSFIKLDAADPQLPQTADDIIGFGPDIVISTASTLFSKDHGLLQIIEENWPGEDQPPPFYILSPDNDADVDRIIQLLNDRIKYANETHPELRFVGVSVAGARDNTLQNIYAGHLLGSFKNAYYDTANYYDAVYYLAYAMAGAGTDSALSGPSIAKGMQRLLSGESYDIGTGGIDAVFKALSRPGTTVHIASTLGPPDFDAATGVRPVEGGVFCFKKVNLTVQKANDVLRYDRDQAALIGNFPCFSGFYP